MLRAGSWVVIFNNIRDLLQDIVLLFNYVFNSPYLMTCIGILGAVLMATFVFRFIGRG